MHIELCVCYASLLPAETQNHLVFNSYLKYFLLHTNIFSSLNGFSMLKKIFFRGYEARSFPTWDSILVQCWSLVVITKWVAGFSSFFPSGHTLQIRSRWRSPWDSFCIFCPPPTPHVLFPDSCFLVYFYWCLLRQLEMFLSNSHLNSKAHSNNYDLPGDAV